MDIAETIASEIRSRGPMPFGRFMELALYHPTLGYYTGGGDPFGKSGDYYTNAQMQPVFGRLLAQRLDRWRHELGAPERFSVLELGPGRGETGREVRRCMRNLEWVPVDVGDSWPDSPLTGVIFCNEFLDALPVDSVERRGGQWVERRVGLSGGRLAWQFTRFRGDPSGLPRIAEGRRIETCSRQAESVARMAAALERGRVLVIDYGYTRDEIERGGRFPDGSLMSYSSHRADPDVLADPGRRDITAHVNFSALADAGRAAGLHVDPLRTQQAFLLETGEPDRFAYALAAGSGRRETELRMQLKSLLFGLGETFRVLVMRKA